MKNPHSDIVPSNYGDYGYGCQLGKFGDIEWYGHGGRANGIATMMFLIPEKNMNIIILTNKDPIYEIIVEQHIINILERYLS